MMVKREGNTKEDILEAAIELYSEQGVAGVSIRDITRKVGINESSLYNHYKGKAELLDAIIEKFQREFGETVFDESRIEERLEGAEPDQFLIHHLMDLRSRITPLILKMWKVVYIEMFRDQRARGFVINEIIGRPVRYYEKAFSLMIAQGKIKTMDPRFLAHELEYGWFGNSIERMLLQADEADITRVVERMFAHIKFICEVSKP